MKHIFPIVISTILLLLSACNESKNEPQALIPLPNQITYGDATFRFNDKTNIVISDDQLKAGVTVFNKKIASFCGHPLEIGKKAGAKGAIIIQLNNKLEEEAYDLSITKKAVTIEAATPAGVFYGLQTLIQMCPSEIHTASGKAFSFNISEATVKDAPQFAWRGMMLDVSRHFFTKEEVKELIDYLAFHKLNVFHWHLVDDQGWRIEIKKYPKLTEVGAWRVDREHLPWKSRPAQKEDEKATYGGFYTQEDIKEVVAYAQERFITVVPEIEMPGHTTSSLAAYPEYSCTGGPFTVEPGGLWPITDIYCAGKEETFRFIEDVLTEVMALFPSQYIHIGGDEANKAEWEKCPKCQARIKNEKLKDEHELQSYFIKRIEKFLANNNRTLIGWDEILEGGLAPNATVMSWRGFKGGIEAAESGHDVVMTPTGHCYLDFYQGPIDTEPIAFNATLNLKQVYKFNPIPKELSADKAKHILGGQGNLWTEQVPDKEHMQYMTFPRMAAMAEVLWTNSTQRNWDNFCERIGDMTATYTDMGINYARSMYTVRFESVFNKETKTIALQLFTELPNVDIYYTTDGSEPTTSSIKYEGPISIDKSLSVTAASFVNGEKAGKNSTVDFKLHKATAKTISYTKQPSDKYKGSSEMTLINSLRGTRNFTDGKWQGFEGEDLEVIIDLQSEQSLTKVTTGCLHQTGSWIFLPKKVEVATSIDGKNFTEPVTTMNKVPLQSKAQLVNLVADLNNVKARYVKVKVYNQGEVPKWHSASGGLSWLFVDEIIVE